MAVTYGKGDASYKAAGEEAGILRLVESFYAFMNDLPEAKNIRAMHPFDLGESIDKLSRFLCGWTGGPKLYSEKYGSIAIPPAHAHLPIGRNEASAWLSCMQHAIDAQNYAPEFKRYLITQLAVPAGRIVTLQENRNRALTPPAD